MQGSQRQSFLSTLSLRRATHILDDISGATGHFYPRSPCGERRQRHSPDNTHRRISIHALLAESDREPTALRTPHHIFLSTLSLRRATIALLIQPIRRLDFYPRSPCGERLTRYAPSASRERISIHALLAESDPRVIREPTTGRQFLSTLSLRRATHRTVNIQRPTTFLSTLSLRRATYQSNEKQANQSISIHALLAESDILFNGKA